MTETAQDLDRVNSLTEWCKRVGISKPTGRRILASATDRR
jgi:hypothetical protein